jgi:hypothetical protein
MYDPTNPYASPIELATPSPPVISPLHGPLAKVATGLGWIWIGAALMTAGLCVIPSLIILDVRPNVALSALAWIGVLGVAGGLLNLIGSLFCLATPQETHARGLIFTSVGAALIVALIVFIDVLQRMKLVAPLPAGVNVAMRLLTGVVAVTFVLFLWRINRFVGRELLARCSALVAVYLLTVTMVQLGLEAYLSTHRGALNSMPAFVIAGLLIGEAIGLSVCALLCRATRRAILAGSN